MKQLTCEMCGGTDLIKQDGVFVCQNCGMKYSAEEAKKMMIEGTVDIQGTVKVDESAFVEKSIQNARRALKKEDWEEVEKYYNLVEQNTPKNMEAVFFSSYGKAVLSLTDSDFYKREQKFKVLRNSISVISDYYDETVENKEESIRLIDEYIKKLMCQKYVYQRQEVSVMGALNALTAVTGSKVWCENLLKSIQNAFVIELKEIEEKHDDEFIKEILNEYIPNENANSNAAENTSAPATGDANKKSGCYVATAVYGSYDCPQVWTLRRYRDNILAKSWYGRAFIHTYYAISPTLVKWFGDTKWFKMMWKGKLDRLVNKLQSDGIASTPYKDRNW